MYEPTREQLNKVDDLALRNQMVRAEPLTADGADLHVQVTGFPEKMGSTTRAPRVFDLVINADGGVVLGVRA